MDKSHWDIKQSCRVHQSRWSSWMEVQWKDALFPVPYNPARTRHHKWTWQSLPGIRSNLALTWTLEQSNSGLFQNDSLDTRLKYLAEPSRDPPSFSLGHSLWDLEKVHVLYSVLQLRVEDSSPFSPRMRAVTEIINTEDIWALS